MAPNAGAAPDGVHLVGHLRSLARDESQPCHFTRFDGRMCHELELLCGLQPIAFALDGTSWVLADGQTVLHVITPEGAAGTR